MHGVYRGANYGRRNGRGGGTPKGHCGLAARRDGSSIRSGREDGPAVFPRKVSRDDGSVTRCRGARFARWRWRFVAAPDAEPGATAGRVRGSPSANACEAVPEAAKNDAADAGSPWRPKAAINALHQTGTTSEHVASRHVNGLKTTGIRQSRNM